MHTQHGGTFRVDLPFLLSRDPHLSSQLEFQLTAVCGLQFDLFPRDLKDKKVLIKPNVLRASEAGEGIVTHPAVLAAVVDKVAALAPALKRGAMRERFFRSSSGRPSHQLGLLGTVLGMIRAFNAIASADAMGRPELLAAGTTTARRISLVRGSITPPPRPARRR